MQARHDPAVFKRLRSGSTWRLWDEIRKIEIPTLIVRGEKSGALSREIGERMVQEIRDARMVEMPGTVHVLNVEDPESFNQIVGDFIRG